MKEPHTALFVAPTGVGKTHLALSLLENEHRNHFDFIVQVYVPQNIRKIYFLHKISKTRF